MTVNPVHALILLPRTACEQKSFKLSLKGGVLTDLGQRQKSA